MKLGNNTLNNKKSTTNNIKSTTNNMKDYVSGDRSPSSINHKFKNSQSDTFKESENDKSQDKNN